MIAPLPTQFTPSSRQYTQGAYGRSVATSEKIGKGGPGIETLSPALSLASRDSVDEYELNAMLSCHMLSQPQPSLSLALKDIRPQNLFMRLKER